MSAPASPEPITETIDEKEVAPPAPVADVVFARVFSTTFEDVLLEAVKAIDTKVANGKKSVPILGSVCLEADADTQLLHVRTTDLERSYHRAIPADIDESSRVCILIPRLRDLLKTLTQPETITLATNALKAHRVRIIAPQNKITAWLSGMPVEEFPAFPDAPQAMRSVTVSIPQFQEAIRRTIFACAKDDARPVFSGVYLHMDKDGFLAFAGADSFRLAVTKIVPEAVSEDFYPTIISAQSLKTFLALTPRAAGTVELQVGRVHVPAQDYMAWDYERKVHQQMTREAHDAPDNAHLLWNGRTLTTTCINGQYPRYEAIIPTDYTHFLEVDRDALANAMGTLSGFAKEASNIVSMRLHGTSEDPAMGQVVDVEWSARPEQDVIEVTTRGVYTDLDDDAEVVFGTDFLYNNLYLADAAKIACAEKLTLSFASPLKPLMIHEVGSPNWMDWVCIIMPFHTTR